MRFLMQRRMVPAIKDLAEAKTVEDRPLIPAASDYAWFFSILGSGLLIIVVLFARRKPDRLPTAIVLTARLAVMVIRFPPVPLSGLAPAALTLLVFSWRVRPSRG